MSKRKNLFIEKTSPYGFDESILADIYDEMVRLRCYCMETRQTIPFEHGRVFYLMSFLRNEDKTISLHGFNAVLRNVPLIEHGVFAGINTGKLEEQMQATDWLYSVSDETALSPRDVNKLVKIWKVMERLKQCGNSQASEIVSLLQMKYWAGTIAESYTHIDMRTSRYDSSQYFDTATVHTDITAVQAYNLLSGRPVFRQANEPNHVEDHWLQLKRITEPSTIRMFNEHKFPGFDLRDKLNVLPLKELLIAGREQQLMQDLNAGSLSHGTLAGQEKDLPVRLSVEPESQSIKVINNDLVIPVIKAIDKHNQQRFAQNKVGRTFNRNNTGKRKGNSL